MRRFEGQWFLIGRRGGHMENFLNADITEEERAKAIAEALAAFPDHPAMREVLKRATDGLPARWSKLLLIVFSGFVKAMCKGKDEPIEEGEVSFEPPRTELITELLGRLVCARIMTRCLERQSEADKNIFFAMAESAGLGKGDHYVKFPEALIVTRKAENQREEQELQVMEAVRALVMEAAPGELEELVRGQVPEKYTAIQELPMPLEFFRGLAAECLGDPAQVRAIFEQPSPDLQEDRASKPVLFLLEVQRKMSVMPRKYEPALCRGLIRKVLLFGAAADACRQSRAFPKFMRDLSERVAENRVTPQLKDLLLSIASDPSQARKWISKGPNNLPDYFLACAKEIAALSVKKGRGGV